MLIKFKGCWNSSRKPNMWEWYDSISITIIQIPPSKTWYDSKKMYYVNTFLRGLCKTFCLIFLPIEFLFFTKYIIWGASYSKSPNGIYYLVFGELHSKYCNLATDSDSITQTGPKTLKALYHSNFALQNISKINRANWVI